MNIISIDYSSSITDAFEAFSNDTHAVLLESAGDNNAAHYSFFSAQPSQVLSQDINNINSAQGKAQLRALKQQLQQPLQATANQSPLPFSGGWIGYANYEFGQSKQHHAEKPSFWAGFYNWAVIFNHKQKNAQLIYLNDVSAEQLASIQNKLKNAPKKSCFKSSAFKQLTHKQQYTSDFNRIQNYLLSGDCYQINYAQSYQATFEGDTFQAYKQLSQAVPSPFMAYMNLASHSILSISPERLLQVQESSIRSSPIKGTEKRSLNSEEDVLLASQLQLSEKNRAENVMIVDLIRNDLSKHAQLGSVKVAELFSIESFSNVHHLVSHIDANLHANSTAFDVFFDAFPGGSITGAPKVRAMQIIDELEQQERGIYCGSIFYASCNQQFDANIAIRTLSCDKNTQTITAWAGGGIVKDSNVDDEYQECKNKIDKLLHAISPQT